MGTFLPTFRNRLRRASRVLCLLAAAMLWLGPSSGAQAQGPRHLVVASSLSNPPYEYLDAKGQPSGYVNDLIRAVAAAEGMEVEIRSMPFGELRGAFERREVDVVTGMVFSEERTRFMDFTVPHSYVPYVLLTRKGEGNIRSERDCAGKDVLVLGRSIMAEHLASLRIAYREMPTHEASIQELASGKGDAALVPKYTYLFFIKNRSIQNLRAVPSEIYPTKRCFAVHKGDEKLLATLNEGLFLVKQNGTLDRIYERHLGALEASEVPFSMVAQRALWILGPAILGLGLAGLLAWSLSLKHLVRQRTAEVDDRNRQLEQLVAQLQAALADVKQLSGLIPICASCKKVRDDQGYWQAVEGYISTHSEATFTHGICPDCVKVQFPDYKRRDPAAPDSASAQK